MEIYNSIVFKYLIFPVYLLFSINTLQAQCTETQGREVWYPDGPVCGNQEGNDYNRKWGSDPWNVRQSSPRTSNNKNDRAKVIGIHPEGSESFAACWFPLYDNRTIFYDPASQSPFTLRKFSTSAISAWNPGHTYTNYGIIFTDNLSLFPCSPGDFSFYPSASNVGTTVTVYSIIYAYMRDDSYHWNFWGDDWWEEDNTHTCYTKYSTFNITVVPAPQWKPFLNICRGDVLQLEDCITGYDSEVKFYERTETGITLIAKDPSRNGTYIDSRSYTGKQSIELIMKRMYDNGEYEKSITVRLSPPGPTINTAMCVLTPTCNGEANGNIRIPANAISTNYESVRWWLYRSGQQQTCTLTTDKKPACVGTLDVSNGAVSRNSEILTQPLAAGSYVFRITNEVEEGAYCYTDYNFTILEAPPLQITIGLPELNPITNTHIACRGEISWFTIRAYGGEPDRLDIYTYGITRNGWEEKVPIVGAGGFYTFNRSAGAYTIEVKRGTRCASKNFPPFKLTEPAPVTAAETHIDPTCSPGNGTIQVNITSAPEENTNFTYYLFKGNEKVDSLLNATVKSRTFSSLNAGSYIVKIMNPRVSGCVLTSIPVTLEPPKALDLTVVKNDSITCFGASTGRLELTGSGGSGNYTYTLKKINDSNNNSGVLTTKNTTGIFPELSAGTYTVTLKNQNASCSANDSLTVTNSVLQRKQLRVELTHSEISCHNARDGKIEAKASEGSKTFYLYHWEYKDNSNAWKDYTAALPTQKDVYNLEPGTYRVVLEDGGVTDCKSTSSEISFTDPPPLQIVNVVATDAVCQVDGAHIEMTVTGGHENKHFYSYSLDEGDTYTDFTRETGLATGSYKIKVCDSVKVGQSECSATNDKIYRITSPDKPLDFTSDLSQTEKGDYNIACHGDKNGTVTLNAIHGNGEKGEGGQYVGYQYKIASDNYQAGSTFPGLAAGDHHFSVKDDRGCEVTHTVTLRHPPALTYTGTKTDINCFGESTGILTPNATGGVSPYTVTVNDIERTVNSAITGLGQGSYQIHIVDALQCAADTTVTIQYKHEALTANVAGTDIKCLGEKGRAVVTSTGGDGRYTFKISFKISSDNWSQYATWQNNSQLEEGTYRFSVEDGLKCTANASQVVEITTPPGALSLTSTLSDYNGYNISCQGGNNGFANLTASGGNGGSYTGYTYALDGGKFGSDPHLDSINAGRHVLKVRDDRGCVETSEVNFTQSPDILSIELVSKEDVLCANSTTGVITVRGKWNGVEASNLEYKINVRPWQPSPTFSGLSAVTHNVHVKDVLACIMSMAVKIDFTNPLIVVNSITHQDIACLNDKASIRVNASGGTGTLTPQYSRNGGEYIALTDTTPLDEGEYMVRVKDQANCYTASDTIRFTSPAAALTFSVVKSDYHGMHISCHGLSTGSLTANATGGNGAAYSDYTYSLDGGDFVNLNNFPGLSAGTHSLRVKDGRGCISTQNPSLEQPEVLSFDITSTTAPKCGAEATGIIVLKDALGGTPSYQYSLDSVNWQSGTTFSSLLKGDYTFYVKDVNDCAAKKTTILESQYPSIVATPDITHVKCFGQSTGVINPTVSGGHGTFKYKWGDNSTQAIIQNQAAGDHTLQVTDDVECTGNFKFTISQPSALALLLEAPSICDTHSNGVITATATGGIAPYLFSLNNQAAQEGNVFSGLTHVTHSVKVEDANVCSATSSITINKLNVKPDVNFLVATRKNALDTLAIKEISLPEPNEVSWDFDPRIERIGNEGSSPLIKCQQAGTYWVEMSGKWSGCDYVVKKEITISPFDPLAGPGRKSPVNVFTEVTLSPNPTTGNIHLSVKLNRKQRLSVHIYSISSHKIDSRQYEPTLSVEQDFTLGSEVSAGTYILRIIAENDSRDVRFVLAR